MTTRRRLFLAVGAVGLLAAAVSACATTGGSLTPLGSATTLMAGWERHFALDWTVEPERGDARRLRGYVSNQHGEYAESVRLLGQALDSSGAVVGQRIAFIPSGVAGSGRASFEIPHLPPADHYRVSVWDYTFHQSDSRH